MPSDKKVEANDVILIDMGCKYNGYCSDMTRMIFVDSIPAAVSPIYDSVLKNQKIVLREIREGRVVKDISRVSECDFNLHGHSLIHALGHGVGIETHEAPILSLKENSVLKENTVLAVEPGIYLNGKFGVRIEDTVLVTKDGCITLTNSGKNYTII